MATLRCIDLGRRAFEPTLALQRRLVRDLQAGDGQVGYLLLVEHEPPVITLGISGSLENVLASPGQLEAAGIAVHRTRRGGDVTYHGPGQLVGYPILKLAGRRQSLRRYLRDLEEVLIRTLRAVGVEGERRDRLTGVWAGQAKLAAIGVAVSRWVTYHGFALNVWPDPAGFGLIVPCGLKGSSVTSLAELTDGPPEMADVKKLLAESMADVFSFDCACWALS